MPIANPFGITFDGANLWVTNAGSDSVTKMTTNGAILATYHTGMGSSVANAFFAGTNIWVQNDHSNTITALRVSDGAVVGTYPAGTGPQGKMAFDGTYLWIPNVYGNAVTKLRVSDGATVATYAVGSFPISTTYDGEHIWVANANSNNVMKLRPSDGAIVLTLSFPHPAEVAFDGASIWVQANGILAKVRSSDGAVLASIGVCPGGGEASLVFDGRNVWSVVGCSNIVQVRARDAVLLRTFPGGDLGGAAFDGTNVWIANAFLQTVTKFRADQ